MALGAIPNRRSGMRAAVGLAFPLVAIAWRRGGGRLPAAALAPQPPMGWNSFVTIKTE